jgi:hypothetical protein
MKEVMIGRQKQLQEALERNKQSQEECRLQKLEIEKKIEISKNQERNEREAKLAIRQAYSKSLEEQLHDIEKRNALEKLKQQREFEQQKSDFFAYEEKLALSLDKAREQFSQILA